MNGLKLSKNKKCLSNLRIHVAQSGTGIFGSHMLEHHSGNNNLIYMGRNVPGHREHFLQHCTLDPWLPI